MHNAQTLTLMARDTRESSGDEPGTRLLPNALELAKRFAGDKGACMFTRRELLIAVLASVVTVLATVGTRAAAPVLSSSVFDWNAMAVETTDVGARRTVFRAPTATLDELECHITTLNPGQSSHPPHKHPEEEILIVREGTVESLVNGTLRRVGPGSVIFQASNQEHAIRNVGETPATYHVFSWKSPGMAASTSATP
jgi:XRE family transcriptional regulator, regulator of sulfur utilization